jgi:hypothetical protein
MDKKPFDNQGKITYHSCMKREYMLGAQKLEIAIKALEEIRRIDGMGADLSPPGPCFDVASKALSRLVKKKKRRVRGLSPKCECEQFGNGVISGNDGRLEPEAGCPRHNEAWKRVRVNVYDLEGMHKKVLRRK